MLVCYLLAWDPSPGNGGQPSSLSERPPWIPWLTIKKKKDLEYAIDGQAHKWEDNLICKPPIILLPFTSVLLDLDQCSSSEFNLWLLLFSIRLGAFDGSWLNLMQPTWDLSHILQVQTQRQDQRALSTRKFWQTTEFKPILAIPFLVDHMVYNSKYTWWCWNHQFCQQAAQLVSNFKMKGNCCSSSEV